MAEVFIANTSRGSMGYSSAIDANAALHLMANRTRNAWTDGAVAELIVTGAINDCAEYHAYFSGK